MTLAPTPAQPSTGIWHPFSTHWGPPPPLLRPGGIPSDPAIPASAETINDGQFHTVELVTFDQMVNLSIDGGSPMTMDNSGKHYTLNSEAPLYVGGRTGTG